ncbi:proline iminopeptidase-family hydrolase [Phytoactinopolyspora mesophila]|uniref:Proline iminopeptidase n=1 Tax=Phytoactinopolyspora mesophila TaxID=2650750 RepID=A0A7K3M7S3_9ACTN|nr:proline iminopeptidase-family hydrolase [Phytoactinopolyspora mesophila]NDL59371.1 proline iminopeptidase-family hydrolase [Phytoactinopolyspora mesophila]
MHPDEPAANSGELYVEFGPGQQLYTRWVGADRDRTPLLCLHGGPGAVSHEGLEPLEGIAADGRQVIFFDQLGCGRSSRPDDPSLWRNDLVCDQIDAIRAAYGLASVAVLGHSYGGWVTQEYALRQPTGLRGIVLADTAPDAEMYLAEGRRIRDSLPAQTRAVLDRHERAGTTDSPEYADAYRQFLEEFTCTIRPLPASIERARAGGNPEIARIMWGPGGRSFEMNGRLRGWSVVDRLPEIGIPVLVITGSEDMASPAIARFMATAIPDARCVIIDGGSHTPFYEDPETFCSSVRTFLTGIDAP